MARTTHENRSGTTDSSFITDTAFVLRNDDDTSHSLDVRIVDDEGGLAESHHTVAGDSQRAVTADTGGTLRVDLRADHGASASLIVDNRRSSAPEFVIRRKTIVVAGLN